MEMDRAVFFNTNMPEAYNAVYTPTVGYPVLTVVLLDKDVERFPGGFESNVSERTTEIEIRSDHAPTPARGETVTVTLSAGDVVYELQDVVADDGFSVRMTVKRVTTPENAMTDGAGNYLVDHAGNYLTWS